jgi:hypothetical protein
MSNAKQLAYALIDALNECGIEEEFSYRFLAEMNDILRKENKKLEMNNEAQALAGNDKELQNNIILLMKEYGLGSGEAYELINRLSSAGNVEKLKASLLMDEAVQESGTCEEPGDIADVMQDVYTSGEDPGDTHEPSKGSGTPNYERILEKLGWFLDCNENLSHYSLYNEIKDILKEHQEQNKPVEYGTPKDIGNGEYAAVINPVPKKPLTIYADGQTAEIKLLEDSQEAREYQKQAFKDMDITFHVVDHFIRYLCTWDIEEVLESCLYLSKGQQIKLPAKGMKMKVYEIAEVVRKPYPSHEVTVQVKEVKYND